ncbi:MAG TPA: Rrf2 family transcriptional regulator [Phycisphaerales bacterium]|nr:Rrf2 family transcriptional regulator [Phycisphaerales bacterium]
MLSRTTEYALRAVVFLARGEGDNTTAQRIAEVTGVPDGYMSKVLNTLARAGVVISQRGPTGGFTLASPAGRLTMLDVVEAVEPLPRIKTCPLALAEHAGALCPLHSVLASLVDEAARRLAETTIADLIVAPIAPPGGCEFPPRCMQPTVDRVPGGHGAKA